MELRWGKSPVPNTVQIDVSSDVGDCFFACVSVWLNVYFGRTLFDPQRLRLSLAAAMAWPEASPVLDRVREDLSTYCDAPVNASLEEMQAIVMKSTTWADHPIIRSWLFSAVRSWSRPWVSSSSVRRREEPTRRSSQ